MARKKKTMALFEVISQARERSGQVDMRVPNWIQAQPQAPAEEDDQVSSPAAETPDADAAAAPQAVPPAVAPASPLRVHPPTAPALDFGEPGRLTVTLSYLWSAVAAGGLVVLLLLAFWLGRSTAPNAAETTETPAGLADTTDAGPQADAPAPDTAARPGPGDPAADAAGESEAARPAAPGERVPDKHYLVIQTLGKDREDLADARALVRWLAGRGIDSEVRRFSNGRYLVWSLRPFDSPTGEAALSFARRIERLGQEAMGENGPDTPSGRKYNFLQRSRRDGEFRPYYKPYTP